MTEIKKGPTFSESSFVDGDVSKTGITRNIHDDIVITPKNKPRPVGPQPKQ